MFCISLLSVFFIVAQPICPYYKFTLPRFLIMKINSNAINHVSEFGHVRYHAAYIKALCLRDYEM